MQPGKTMQGALLYCETILPFTDTPCGHQDHDYDHYLEQPQFHDSSTTNEGPNKMAVIDIPEEFKDVQDVYSKYVQETLQMAIICPLLP